MTVAPVVKSVLVESGRRECVRGVHARDRLVVAARPAGPRTRRGARGRMGGAEGGEVYRSRGGRAVALGDRARLGAAVRLHDCLEGRSRAVAPTEVEVRLRPTATAPRWCWSTGTGTGSEQVPPRPGATTTAAGGWCSAGTSTRSAWALDADVDRLGRRAVAQKRSQELGEAAGSEGLLGRVELGRRPPAQLEEVLGVELLPAQRRLRRERRRADEVIQLALPVPLAADERDDVEPRPDDRADGRPTSAPPPRRARGERPPRASRPARSRRPVWPRTSRPGTRSGRAGSGRPGRARWPALQVGSGAWSSGAAKTMRELRRTVSHRRGRGRCAASSQRCSWE